MQETRPGQWEVCGGQNGQRARALQTGTLRQGAQAGPRATSFISGKRLSIDNVPVALNKNVSVSPNTAVFRKHIRMTQEGLCIKDLPPRVSVAIFPMKGDARAQKSGQAAIFTA